MTKRILDCTASDFSRFTKADLLEAIRKSEGRTLACETIGAVMPILNNVTNAEFAAAMGADILLLNMFDVQSPCIQGLPECAPTDTIRVLKRLTGRPVGINLEPVPEGAVGEADPMWAMTAGRKATVENAMKAKEMGIDFILLTGNPGMGVTNETILATLRQLKAAVGDSIVLAAGKMHGAGVFSRSPREFLSTGDVERFILAGADILLLPAPGTVPGITLEYAGELIAKAHSLGALTVTSIGTSQEGADPDTIRRIALMCKMAGTDIHHIGDTGFVGIASPENITAYSIAIRGIRHTYHRMACSVNR